MGAPKRAHDVAVAMERPDPGLRVHSLFLHFGSKSEPQGHPRFRGHSKRRGGVLQVEWPRVRRKGLCRMTPAPCLCSEHGTPTSKPCDFPSLSLLLLSGGGAGFWIWLQLSGVADAGFIQTLAKARLQKVVHISRPACRDLRLAPRHRHCVD